MLPTPACPLVLMSGERDRNTTPILSDSRASSTERTDKPAMTQPYPPEEPYNYGPPPTGQPYQPYGYPSQYSQHPQPWPPYRQGFAPTPPPKKKRKWPWILGGVIVVILAIGFFSSGSGSTSQNLARTTTVSAQPPDPTRLDPATYEQLTERDFALLIKNPEAAAGRRIVVYGDIMQFDTATGDSQFLADTAAIQQEGSYHYRDSAFVVLPDPQIAANVVQDDIVKMYVEVAGTFSYETLLGDHRTVPKFRAYIIEVVGP